MANSGVFYDPFLGRFVPADNASEIGSTEKPVNKITAKDVTATGALAVTGAATVGGALAVTGALTVTGAFTPTAIVVPALVFTAADTIAVSVAQSGTTFIATKATATQVFTLPTAAAGLTYTFVAGHADGEVLINPQAATDDMNGVGFAITGATGIKNTAATNVVGDSITFVGSALAWWATNTNGIWAAQ